MFGGKCVSNEESKKKGLTSHFLETKLQIEPYFRAWLVKEL